MNNTLRSNSIHVRPSRAPRSRHLPLTAADPPHHSTQRRACGCSGRTHAVYSNCQVCGRIFCQAEGEGPCFFCSSWVAIDTRSVRPSGAFVSYMMSLNDPAYYSPSSAEAATHPSTPHAAMSLQALIDSYVSDYLQQDLIWDDSSSSKAEKAKQRLLRFAKEDSQNTTRHKIHDDQSDFFEYEGNQWMNSDDRKAAMAEAKNREDQLFSRGQHVINLNLSTKTVTSRPALDNLLHAYSGSSDDGLSEQKDSKPQVVTSSSVSDSDPPQTTAVPTENTFGTIRQPSHVTNDVGEMVDEMKLVSSAQYYRNNSLHGRARQIYEELQHLRNTHSDETAKDVSTECTSFASRVQYDEDLDRIQIPDEQYISHQHQNGIDLNCNVQDSGVALSMHQPWASLLVLGIKKLEGRPWSTKHRGRLWIASAAHETGEEEIHLIEAEVQRSFASGTVIPFPKEYPTSALLGCVDLTACLIQPELQSWRAAEGERENSTAAHVFVCENPKVLALPQHISGQHKLWTLNPKLAATVSLGLQPVDITWRHLMRDRSADSSINSKKKNATTKTVKTVRIK